MSAYIVDKETILYIVSAFAKVYARQDPLYWERHGVCKSLRKDDPKQAAYVANTLAAENLRSCQSRYSRSGYFDDCQPDTFSGISLTIGFPLHLYTVVQVAKAIDCLEYQSCESDDWRETEACKILTAMRRRLLMHIPGYDAAEWGHPPAKPKGGRQVEGLANSI